MKALVTRVLTVLIYLFFTSAPLYALTSPQQTFYPLDSYDSAGDYYPDEKWHWLVHPENEGWSLQKLQEAEQYAKKIGSATVMAIHRGVVVFTYGDYTVRYRLHSVRKSLMSVIYGVFVGSGVIDLDKTLLELGIDDKPPLYEYEKQATVRNLLMSMSGVYHPAAYETLAMIDERPDRGSYAPGEHWYYNNWDFNTLVTIFNQETGGDFFKAFALYLAEPLQMEQFRPEDTKYYYEEEKSLHPAYLFEMSAVDLARIGLLYLREGLWHGEQIVPASWVAASTSAQHQWDNEPEWGYGYLWRAVADGFYAAGVGGQRIIVAPKYDLVLVHQVDTRAGDRVKSEEVWDLYDKIVAAMPAQQNSGGGGSSVSDPTIPPTPTNPRSQEPPFIDEATQVFTLNIVSPDVAGIRIVSQPAGIDCGTDCSGQFPANTQVSFNFSLPDGVRFNGWLGECAGASAVMVSDNSKCMPIFLNAAGEPLHGNAREIPTLSEWILILTGLILLGLSNIRLASARR